MEQVGKKDKLLKSEITAAAVFFQLGTVFSYSLIGRGNINSNYILLTNSGKYLLRAYKFKTEKEIISELGLLNYLSRKGFPCPIPVGNIYKTKKKNICCFKYIEGRELKKVTDKKLREIANLMANLHILTRNYHLKNKREGEGLAVIKRYLKNKKGVILKSKFRNSQKFIDFLESEIKKLHFDSNLPSGAIHVDVKAENVILGKDGRLSFIDFDNFYLDSFITDIANAIMWLCVNKDQKKLDRRKAKIFLTEYGAIRKLTKKEIANLHENYKFYCLKGAFKYAYICLPRLKFAERWAYYFVELYKNISKQDISCKF
ncbi:MAG: Homoserine kinase [Candidatus Moranbacteria bacterium GW2011_GWC1_45_18]|nr:MAG: Homoserine kinase [Candidatus Moranbacteria bacterium GW2011_GWC2_40_12]KKT34115.1 MAG: Homoserine kinase [Candidatus Moranbacteria bacterium GW2011_GWF2_44_10]KKT69811.1 MAG: Homoserine kinase [Candidatus Moranbacteria bacterium GW2011_GWF1_44_4]KKU00673.1 MAG: Homoserine kinase [Candidatus Moranbacteria bacterium GW2011_GWC1_45_18]OGI24538.1 MAG: hypothetical protein A2194_00255 [Candidatus Moranbacteria bacterium RIFOXYA1_FULL_44_8]OGI36092.1 MAG: hypothetical protein A2407_02100 [C